MHTFGAVILAIVFGVIVQLIFGLIGTTFAHLVESTTGIQWLGYIMITGLVGCGAFGSLYCALKIVQSASAKITFYTIALLFVASGVRGLIQEIDGGTVSIGIFLAFNTLASLIGAWVAFRMIVNERLESD